MVLFEVWLLYSGREAAAVGSYLTSYTTHQVRTKIWILQYGGKGTWGVCGVAKPNDVHDDVASDGLTTVNNTPP